LTKINSHKRALVLESELNRQILRLEFGRIHAQTERLKHSYGWAQGAWKWAIPIAGFLLARKFKRRVASPGKGSLILGSLGAAWKLFQAVRARHSGPPRSR